MKRPAVPVEVRICIFDTLKIKMMDDDGCSDVFIRTFFDSKEAVKETDTHFRCQDGKASFNYRLIFDITHPRKKNDYSLNVQAYDRDFFKSNDIIGEVKVDLRQAIEDVILTKRPIGLNKAYYNKVLKQLDKDLVMDFKDDSSFWVQLVTIDSKGKIEKTGQVRMQIDIYPKSMAEMNKVGDARSEPNANPFLPPPIGRISFSLNPLKMFVSILPLCYSVSHNAFIVTTGWSSFEKKDLLLLLSGSLPRHLSNVSAHDPQQYVHCPHHAALLLRLPLVMVFLFTH